MVITPERPVELEDIFEEMRQVWVRGKRHFIIVLARRALGRRGTVINDSDKPYDARYTVLGYIQRGGVPSRFDASSGRAWASKQLTLCWTAYPGHSLLEEQSLRTHPPRGDPWDEMLSRVHTISAT